VPALPDPETVGPVDVALIYFEGNQFNGEVASRLAELDDAGTVHLLDVALVAKDEDGNVLIIEVEDEALAEAFARLGDSRLDLLNDEDLDAFATAVPPGSSALVIVFENTWVAKFATAVRESKGELAYMQRIPRESVQRALAALTQE
jgi:uncharacterized membrane protein